MRASDELIWLYFQMKKLKSPKFDISSQVASFFYS